MFVQYRGGGVGHKYMREVEAQYEDMSLKRVHGKPRSKRPRDANGTTGTHEGPQAPLDDQNPPQHSGPQEGSHSNGDESDLDDSDYMPPGTNNSNGEGSTDSDEDSANSSRDSVDGDKNSDDDTESVDSEADFDEVGSDDGHESFGLADP